MTFTRQKSKPRKPRILWPKMPQKMNAISKPKTPKSNSMKTPEQTETEEFEHHAARAFFASAWADAAEESNAMPWPPGGEIMGYMPQEIDPAATHAARTLRFDIESANKKTIGELMGLIERDGAGDRENTIEFFGHYATMQAMGHGVGLSDAFGDVADSIRVPYVEFGAHSLQKDYF